VVHTRTLPACYRAIALRSVLAQRTDAVILAMPNNEYGEAVAVGSLLFGEYLERLQLTKSGASKGRRAGRLIWSTNNRDMQ